jgi:hypothetical protein
MAPVLEDLAMASTTAAASWSWTTTLIRSLGSRRAARSAVQASGTWPYCWPKPRTSATVMPRAPALIRARVMSSSLPALTMAVISFTALVPLLAAARGSRRSAVGAQFRRPSERRSRSTRPLGAYVLSCLPRPAHGRLTIAGSVPNRALVESVNLYCVLRAHCPVLVPCDGRDGTKPA